MNSINELELSEINSLLPALPPGRRAFMASVLGTGFALAVQPVMAQSVIKTSAVGLDTGAVDANGRAGAVKGYYARPNGNKTVGVVLVVSEIFGVHEHIADVCRRLAHAGYLAIAPELFARYGDPRQVSSIPEIMSNIVAKVPDDEVMADLDACIEWAVAHGGDRKRLAITGFCWGGRITWLYAAHNPALRAAVVWYGRLRMGVTPQNPRHPIDIVNDLKVPVLGLYGGLDQGIPLVDVEEMQKALEAAGKASEIHVYENAPHAFNADYRPSYRKDEAEDGWKRMLAWMAKYGM